MILINIWFDYVSQEEDLAKELNFFSISSDGQVASWIMSKNEVIRRKSRKEGV